MTKDDLLKELATEYASNLMRSDDVTVQDFQMTFLRNSGVKIGIHKAMNYLNKRVESGDLVSMLAIDQHGRNRRIWRKVEPKKKAGK